MAQRAAQLDLQRIAAELSAMAAETEDARDFVFQVKDYAAELLELGTFSLALRAKPLALGEWVDDPAGRRFELRDLEQLRYDLEDGCWKYRGNNEVEYLVRPGDGRWVFLIAAPP